MAEEISVDELESALEAIKAGPEGLGQAVAVAVLKAAIAGKGKGEVTVSLALGPCRPGYKRVCELVGPPPNKLVCYCVPQ